MARVELVVEFQRIIHNCCVYSRHGSCYLVLVLVVFDIVLILISITVGNDFEMRATKMSQLSHSSSSCCVDCSVTLEDMRVYFPYDYMYPEQYDYMLEIKHALDAKVA